MDTQVVLGIVGGAGVLAAGLTAAWLNVKSQVVKQTALIWKSEAEALESKVDRLTQERKEESERFEKARVRMEQRINENAVTIEVLTEQVTQAAKVDALIDLVHSQSDSMHKLTEIVLGNDDVILNHLNEQTQVLERIAVALDGRPSRKPIPKAPVKKATRSRQANRL